MKLAISIKGEVRALLAKHDIRLQASDLDGDTRHRAAGRAVTARAYAQRLASGRRLLLILADEIASVELDLHAGCVTTPGTAIC